MTRSRRLLLSTLASVAFAQASFAAPVVLAHRGASGYVPEHSLLSKAVAHAQGADFLEQDLVLTKDGVPIVLHDIHLDTTTDVAKKFPDRQRPDGRYYAIDFTLAEIKQLDATSRVDLRTGAPAYPKRFAPGAYTYSLQTLEEEIRFIQALNASTGRQVGLYTEIKQPTFHQKEGQDILRIVAGILRRHGYGDSPDDSCWIQCFEETTLKRLRTEFGWKGRLMMILGGAKPGADGSNYDRMSTPAGMEEVARFADAIGPGISRLVKWDEHGRVRVSSFTRDAHARGLQVHWGVIRADDLPANCPSLDALHEALYLTAGADGGFTDHPDLTVEWLKQRGLR